MTKVLQQLVKDPQCLLFLSPKDGGTWLSPIRPDKGIVPQPPRNFSVKSHTWWEQYATLPDVDITHDHEFVIKITATGRHSTAPTQSVYYDTSNSILWGVWRGVNGNIRVYCGVFAISQAPAQAGFLHLRPAGAPPLAEGVHTIKIYAVGDMMIAQLDDEPQVASVMSRGANTAEVLYPPSSNFDGTILYIRHTDLTTDKVILQYPSSLPEKLGLTIKHNIYTARGVIEPAIQTRHISAIVTPIDLSGYDGALTFVCKASFGDLPTWSQSRYYHLMGQTLPWSVDGPISITIQRLPSGAIGVHVRANGYTTDGALSAGSRTFAFPESLVVNKTAVVAVVLDLQHDAIVAYIDGGEIGRAATYGGIVKLYTGANRNLRIGCDTSHVSTFLPQPSFYYAGLFARALSENEIKLFS